MQTLSTPSNFTPFCVGDHVWLEARNLDTTHPIVKLTPRCHGPFLITTAISHVLYPLKVPSTWQIHNVFHASLLTPYKETFTNGQQYQEPTPDLVEGNLNGKLNISWVQGKDIINSNTWSGRKGFSKAHNSWEPLTHSNTNQQIKEFYQANPLLVHTNIKEPVSSPTTIIIHSITMTTVMLRPGVWPNLRCLSA